MRIWLDPDKLTKYNLMPGDVIAAIQTQNTQVTAGQLGGLPSVGGQQLNATITSQSRLQTVEQFKDIILRTATSGQTVRIGDVARVELGSKSYDSTARYNGKPAAGMKGAFGGGFSIVGIPLLSFVMDPVTAGGLLAPLFIAMDLFALRYWKPSTWSKPDLALLLPGLLIGIGLGYGLFRVLDHRAVAIVMAVVTLVFVGLWFFSDPKVIIRPRSKPKAVAAGLASGVTTMYLASAGYVFAVLAIPRHQSLPRALAMAAATALALYFKTQGMLTKYPA